MVLFSLWTFTVARLSRREFARAKKLLFHLKVEPPRKNLLALAKMWIFNEQYIIHLKRGKVNPAPFYRDASFSCAN